MAEFPMCPMRKRLLVWGAGGEKTTCQRCAEQDAEKANQNVTPEDCLECPERASLVRGVSHPWAKPKLPRGSDRGALKRDPGGAGYTPCATRQLLIVPPSCGGCNHPTEYRVCDGDKAPHFRGIVTPQMCAMCPFTDSRPAT
jgi:hypothetical protein